MTSWQFKTEDLSCSSSWAINIHISYDCFSNFHADYELLVKMWDLSKNAFLNLLIISA